ncbi:MAG: GH25 family lysozyme [Lachnospiraceae bacterium]|nr:GH25 family lysozyme [Lachnospiraceae bacterium]
MFKKLFKSAVAMLLAGVMVFSVSVEAKAATPLRYGIDVSYHQGPINWSAVKSSGVQFAIIRAGSFKSGTDAYFHQNMKGAIAAGLPVGIYVYSYATTPEMAANEGLFAVSVAKDYPVSLPIAYDIEDAYHVGMTPDQLQTLVNSFCNTVSAYGYYPMVYSSKNWFLNRIGQVSWDTWVAQYNTACNYPYPYTFWQCTSSGSVAGINGRVDMDYQFKDYSAVIPANGFKKSGGKTFYMENYMMHRGFLTTGGATYYFDPLFGIMQTGLVATDKGTCYFGEDGKMQTGAVKIGDFQFYFDPKTGVLAPNVSVKIGKKDYITNAMGVLMEVPEMPAVPVVPVLPLPDATAVQQ